MMNSDKQNRPFFWATHFFRELYNSGVDHLVISPGSRSTPLVMAAAAHDGFDKHVVLDERSAAYIALGIGKATGKPAALICTSGTAAANYYPAVIESRQSGVPLVVCSADRPPNLRSTGANQAIDQIKMFGNYPVFFHEAGEPVLESPDMDRLRQLASQAFSYAVRRKGPAHLNFPFRKPLEPDPKWVKKIRTENRNLLSVRTPATNVHATHREPLTLPGPVRTLMETSKRPVVISGPPAEYAPHPAGRELAGLLAAPHLAEYTNGRGEFAIRGFNGFLSNQKIREELNPDLVIRFGQQPVSKAVNLYLEAYRDVPQIHFGDLEEWHDAAHSVTHRIDWFGRKVLWQLGGIETVPDWTERWKDLDRQFREFRTRQLELESSLTDGHVFDVLSNKIDPSWNVFLSNSFPVRDMLLFGETDRGKPLVNRGSSGIDGVLSTAIGTSIGSNKGTILFIGDLALLHDSNALLSGKLLDQPLIVIVLNNRGGTIFRMLPIFEQDEHIYTKFFETPQQAEFENMAGAFSVPADRVTSRKQLEGIDLADYSRAGLHLVECQTDPGSSIKLRETLWNFTPK